MTSRATAVVVALIVAMCTSCSEPRERIARETFLDGGWHVSFSLDVASAMHAGGAKPPDITGRLAFVSNGSLLTAVAPLGTATDIGVYQVNFGAFGFDPRNPDAVPTVTAVAFESDSAIMRFGDPSRGVVIMRGLRQGDSVVGTWRMDGARTGALGRFVMVPSR